MDMQEGIHHAMDCEFLPQRSLLSDLRFGFSSAVHTGPSSKEVSKLPRDFCLHWE